MMAVTSTPRVGSDRSLSCGRPLRLDIRTFGMNRRGRYGGLIRRSVRLPKYSLQSHMALVKISTVLVSTILQYDLSILHSLLISLRLGVVKQSQPTDIARPSFSPK
jgi:hypothetical protein